MANLQEITPQSLPEDFTVPGVAYEVIIGNLGPFADKNNLLALRPDYIPDFQVEEVCKKYDAIFIAASSGQISEEEYSVHMGTLGEESPEGKAKDLAEQLTMIGQLNNLINGYQIEEAVTRFVGEFCPANSIDIDDLSSVFQSPIQHPSAQASVIGFIKRANKLFDTERTDQLMLALRWHLLPQEVYKVHALVGSLTSIAMRKFSSGEEERVDEAAELFFAAAQLAYSVNDPTAHEMIENAALVRCEQGRFGEALALSQEAVDRAEQLGIGEEQLAITKGNLLVTKAAALLQNATTQDDQFEKLVDRLEEAIRTVQAFEQKASLLELLLATYKIHKRLRYYKLAEEYRQNALALRKKYNSEYAHPGVRDIAKEIFTDGVEIKIPTT